MEIPSVKLHCPPATVEVFLKASGEYFEKKGENNLSLKIKKFDPESF